MKKPLLILSCFSLITALFAFCGGPTEPERIRGVIKDLARSAEDRDADAVMAWLTDDYADFEGRDKDATRQMLEEYFARYRGIVINVLRTQIDELTTSEATVQADLVFSSGAAKVFRKFAQISLDNYRLKVTLRKSGAGWLVTSAEWRPIGPGELLSGPEEKKLP
jgi:ketosteroid isomerase-like protein